MQYSHIRGSNSDITMNIFWKHSARTWRWPLEFFFLNIGLKFGFRGSSVIFHQCASRCCSLLQPFLLADLQCLLKIHWRKKKREGKLVIFFDVRENEVWFLWTMNRLIKWFWNGIIGRNEFLLFNLLIRSIAGKAHQTVVNIGFCQLNDGYLK